MSEQESELPNIKVYQPWSAPLLHFRLSDEQIEDLLEITDLALEDKNTKSYNDKLAGEIEGEWEIPDYEDLSEVLNLPTISSQYFQVLASQNLIEIEGENTTMSQHLALFAQNLDKSILISAWFNDQKDDEYNPMHMIILVYFLVFSISKYQNIYHQENTIMQMGLLFSSLMNVKQMEL